MDDILKIQQGDRLYQVLKAIKITQMALSQKTGIAQSTISAMMLGKREINKNALNALKKFLPNLNLNWLLWGDGEMFLGESPPINEVKEPEPVYNLDPLSALRSLLDSYEKRMNEMDERLHRVEAQLNL